MRNLVFLTLLSMLVLAGCARQKLIKEGPWLGVIRIDTAETSMNLPFNMYFDVTPDAQKVMQISNGEEKIMITEIAMAGDTLIMKFPVYLSEIVAVLRGDSMVGRYYPKGRTEGTYYSFYALSGLTDRFPWATEKAEVNITGRWRITENPGMPDSSVMVGEFTQDSNHVTGTILNSGGDYRYLEGKVSGRKFMISAIDGAHTLILTAELPTEGQMGSGHFMGSPRWRSSWVAVRDENAKLPAMQDLVRVKSGAPPFSFAFPDITGDTVSLSDERFRGKVVLVMAIGTWCPNCLDETDFYKELYSEYNSRGFEAVALCFEDATLEGSKARMERFIAHTGASYQFLYAGPRGKGALQKVLFNLEGYMAYPTSMFIDRKGIVRKVETGFSGPGTGVHYTRYTEDTRKFLEDLLAEKP
jgi:peroxiredoxin